MATLEVRGITRRYGGMFALSGADVSLSAEESVGLIGPNGSGKTTLLKIISGFVEPTAGSVCWKGQDITRWPIYRRVAAGIVRTFQHTAVFPELSVRDNIRVAIESGPSDLRYKGAGELADFVGIAHLIDTPAGRLSWGESRLLGIALVLALRPLLLLVDEPFAGLSPLAAEQVIDLLTRIHSSGTGICLIDHDMDYLRAVCQRVVLLVDGAVAADGPTDEVLQSETIRSAYLGGPAC